MFIHNFYTDLLLSIKVLFNKYIFDNERYVRRYEFNIGNRTFQLPSEYQTNFDFPVAIVTLNDESVSYGQRPDVSMGLFGHYNVDQVPVLYNSTKEIVLYLQEEMVDVPITVNFNCESQLQAKEIANIIKRWLPMNKYIQFLDFTSFLEVSNTFLDKMYFEPDVDTISNLYMKLNSKTGDMNYCFSVRYYPFIRLNSVTTAIPDSSQRSFQTSVDLTYMIQFPLYLFSDKLPKTVEKIDVSFNSFAFEPISDYPSGKLVNQMMIDLSESRKGFIRRNYILYEGVCLPYITVLDTLIIPNSSVVAKSSKLNAVKTADEYLLVGFNDSDSKYKIKIEELAIAPDVSKIDIDSEHYLSLTKDLAGDITITFNKTKCSLTVKFDPKDFLMDEKYSYNLINGKSIAKNFSDYTLDLNNNTITFYFNKEQWNRYKPSLTRPLIIQFYDYEGQFPFQIGGLASYFGKVSILPRPTYCSVIWTSGVPARSCYINYGTVSENYTDTVFVDYGESLRQTHKIVLRPLVKNTTYFFIISFEDESNNLHTSKEFTFTTPDF